MNTTLWEIALLHPSSDWLSCQQIFISDKGWGRNLHSCLVS